MILAILSPFHIIQKKKKTIQEIIELFSKEAFNAGDSKLLSKNFSMIIGVNQKNTEGEIDITAKLPKSDFTTQFKVTVMLFLWSPTNVSTNEKPPMGDICNYINKSELLKNI